MAATLFGPTEEEPYRVRADYSKFERRDYSSSDYDSTAAGTTDDEGTPRGRANPQRRRGVAPTSTAGAGGVPGAPPPAAVGAGPESEGDTVGAAAALGFATELHALHARASELAPGPGAQGLTAALRRLCEAGARSGDSAGPGAGALVGRLAHSCRELSDVLLRLEYELRRAQWKSAGGPARAGGDDEGAALLALLAADPAKPREAQSEVAAAAEAAAGRVVQADAASSGGSVAALSGSNKSTMEEELWVMDRLEEV